MRFKWRGPDLNRRPRGYEEAPKSCKNHSNLSDFKVYFPFCAFARSVMFFQCFLRFIVFRFCKRGMNSACFLVTETSVTNLFWNEFQTRSAVVSGQAVSTAFVRFQWGNGSHCQECQKAHYSPSAIRVSASSILDGSNPFGLRNGSLACFENLPL